MNTELRQKPRINDPLPVIVRSSKGQGKTCQFNAVTRNIGAGGLCAVAPRIIKKDERVSLFVRFALAGTSPPQAPSLAARADVLRVEEQRDGSCVFAVSFHLRHIF